MAAWVRMEMPPGEPARRLLTVPRHTARVPTDSDRVSKHGHRVVGGYHEGYKTGLSMLAGVFFSLVLYWWLGGVIWCFFFLSYHIECDYHTTGDLK